jgi:hypothetical protein
MHTTRSGRHDVLTYTSTCQGESYTRYVVPDSHVHGQTLSRQCQKKVLTVLEHMPSVPQLLRRRRDTFASPRPNPVCWIDNTRPYFVTYSSTPLADSCSPSLLLAAAEMTACRPILVPACCCEKEEEASHFPSYTYLTASKESELSCIN